MLSAREQKKAAQAFVERWQGHGYEKGESQKFWFDLLQSVYGVENPSAYMDCEVQVQLEHTSFIDIYLPATKVMIEQKSLGKDLSRPIRQSDGSLLTPMQQLKRYAAALGYFKYPRWGITCNFAQFYIYDMGQPNGEPSIVELRNLPEECHRLNFLVDTGDDRIQKELSISLDAGTIVGRLYESLLQQYGTSPTEEMLQSLNMLIVRIVFCLYAEDAGIFGRRNIFQEYLSDFKPSQVRRALLDLFGVLDTPVDQRDPYLEDNLAQFPYVNGGLFASSQHMMVPQFSSDCVELILQIACPFDWSGISPTIFGAVFESTLSAKVRRSGGMHYTSLENIHKVIDPLFLNELKAEYESILDVQPEAKQRKLLEAFQQKLSSLVFLDPAAGSGNFLTETYISLRRLENQVIGRLTKGQVLLGLGDMADPVQVSIHQFYGIEINDFACVVAKTAMWIAELQMLEETKDIIQRDMDLLPLKSYANIIEGNALQLDWNTVVPREKCSYIMGNPPFVGMKYQSESQKADMAKVMCDIDGYGSLDFVCAWYVKAMHYMKNTTIVAAFVSTNSITQGTQAFILWKPLMEQGIKIIFAYQSFVWSSEASQMAAVHCVIVGFSYKDVTTRLLYRADSSLTTTQNINAYLTDADNVFISNRTNPICNVPKIIAGNKPVDGNFLKIEASDYDEFIKKEPNAKKFIKRLIGGDEFINNKLRYVLWLVDATPAEIKSMPKVLERVKLCREARLNMKDAGARKLADTPTTFRDTLNPKQYLVIPIVSSENRRYIPIGFMDSTTIPTNQVQIIPNAGVYELGVLTSNVHMAWMRTVAGRLKSDYRYTAKIVYNNFPWPTPTDSQRAKIEKTAQAILDARSLYPDSSLADLYDEVLMPVELRRAHQANDRAVMEAYGFWGTVRSESQCVARLMEMYQHLTT